MKYRSDGRPDISDVYDYKKREFREDPNSPFVEDGDGFNLFMGALTLIFFGMVVFGFIYSSLNGC